MTREELWRASKWAQQAIACLRPPGDSDQALLRDVRAIFLEEVKKGWLVGPLRADQVAAHVGPCWIPSRRFGVKQGSKVRAVDDFSEFWVNDTVSATEKLDLGGVDEIAAICHEWMRSVKGDRYGVLMPDGSRLEGALHPSWCGSPPQLNGRTLDLRSAYKQWAVLPADQAASVVSVWNPHVGTYEFFLSIALPFGAVASVYGFNRAARAFRAIATRLCGLVLAAFFDDFPQVEPAVLGVSGQECLEGLAEVLGWDYALDEKKRAPADVKFVALGVEFYLSESGKGVASVSNKPGRVDEIEGVVNLALRSGLTPFEAASLRGRLQYAEGQTFGRCASGALATITDPVALLRKEGKPSTELCRALSWLVSFLRRSPPRKVYCRPVERSAIGFNVFLFTSDPHAEPTRLALGVEGYR